MATAKVTITVSDFIAEVEPHASVLDIERATAEQFFDAIKAGGITAGDIEIDILD